MVYNHFIKCQVCGTVTRIRFQVGLLKGHPVVVACCNCGTSMNGYVDINQECPGLRFQFENADEVQDNTDSRYFVECSGEFPTIKPHADSTEGRIALSPFMRYTSIMGSERYEKFAQSISKLNNLCDHWSQYKRIIDLYNRGNRTYLTAEIWKMLPKEHFPCRNEFEISRAVHMIEVLYFIGVLRVDIISDLSLSTSVVHLAPEQLRMLITFLNSHDGYSLKQLQSSIYKIYNEFIKTYPFLIPALSLQYCDDGVVDYDAEGSTTSSFDLIKQFSLDAYETLGNLLVVPVALNNINYRNNCNQCAEKDGKTVDLEKYIALSKANRFHYCDETEQYTKELQVILNSKLRNAIGHNDVEYDAITQKITYIPNPKDRTKKETAYLLEFENEAIYLFQAITVISEYLYRLREIEMIENGHVPLPVDQGLTPFKKVDRNEPCPCGSGLKYKKCHGR